MRTIRTPYSGWVDQTGPGLIVKILRVIARLNVGGPARHVLCLTRDLQDEEFRSWLIAGSVPEGEEGMEYLAEESGIKPIYISEMSRELSVKDIVSLYKIYREIKRIQPDVLHTHTAKAGSVGRSAGFLYRWLTFGTLVGKPRPLKVVHTFHGHVFHSYYGRARTRIFITIEKILARIATDKIVVISEQQFQEIHNTYGIGRADQFAIVHLGIDLRPFEKLPARETDVRFEIGAGKTDFLVGFVGRLTEIKNLPLLLSAAQRLGSNGNSSDANLKFLIVGEGHMRAALEAQTKEMGLEGRVYFLGNRTDVQDIYPVLDAVALTSLNEGTPLSLIEAMASGKPVISTSVGGVVDLLGSKRREVDGFAVCERGIGTTPNSVEGLANGLLYLVTNDELREEIGSNARGFVMSNFSEERLVADIKRLYRGLLEQGS
jgi:glycosyltransferase involved in cell wall biosynthesis